MPTTLKQAKDSRIGKVLGVCPDLADGTTNPTWLQIVNEAQSRLMRRGAWVGTYQRLRICLRDGCIVWPRQVEHVEWLRSCNDVALTRNEWWDFLPYKHFYPNSAWDGHQFYRNTFGDMNLVDKGTTPIYSAIRGTNKKIELWPELSVDAGKRVFLQGTNEFGDVIRTNDGGTMVDGEWVTLAFPKVSTTNYFSILSSVQKDDTAGLVRVYELAPDASIRQIAAWEPTETVPNYRRTYLSNPPSRTGSCCKLPAVEALVKLAYVPAQRDTDFLVIGNLEALKYECQAIKKEEDDLTVEAEAYHQKAIRELQHELRTYNGRDNASVFLSINGSAPQVRSQL